MLRLFWIVLVRNSLESDCLYEGNQYTTGDSNAVANGPNYEIQAYQSLTYTYLNDERLASITSPSTNDTYQLAYDALGRCVRRTLNGVITYYVYDGEKPILEYNNVYQRVGWNLYGKGIDEILMRTDYVILPSGQGYFYQQDHEGSVTHLTGWIGEVIESYRYDAFGAITMTSTTGVFNSRFKFTGREYMPTFGIYEYRNRAYHPGLGRFTSEDPSGFAAGDYNLFRYCGNDPLDLTDPMGLDVGAAGHDASEVYRLPDGYVFEKTPSESAAAERLREWAISKVGSHEWRKDKGNDYLKAGDNKCSQFVNQGVKAATGKTPAVTTLGRIIKNLMTRGIASRTRPPSSNQLGDSKRKVDGLSETKSRGNAHGGDIIAEAHKDGTGHAGIVVGRDTTVSVSDLTTPKGIVIINDWGFREEGSNNSNSSPLVRSVSTK